MYFNEYEMEQTTNIQLHVTKPRPIELYILSQAVTFEGHVNPHHWHWRQLVILSGTNDQPLYYLLWIADQVNYTSTAIRIICSIIVSHKTGCLSYENIRYWKLAVYFEASFHISAFGLKEPPYKSLIFPAISACFICSFIPTIT